ncbi:hypothetical protein BB560_005820 [Smittium megazygosporum]|uniref:Mitochondrial outer membrane protein porin n=1 Tax=Smittium megazygosporum TaxID=133381 RepID=A0A2T9YV22_9FUNG|nr:hypothetical protein BB560_005820 [Smittium megazygosporum]
MIPPKYSDVLKPCNDLFSKDFPFGVRKLEVKSKAENGTEFKVSGALAEKSGAIFAEAEGKYIDKVNNLTYTDKIDTNNFFTLQVDSENAFAKGLKLSAKGSASLVSQKRSLKADLFFKQSGMFSHATADLLANDIAANVVVSQNGLLAGAEFGYSLAKGNLRASNVLVGYVAKDYTAVLSTSNLFNNISGSVFQRVNPGVLDVAFKVDYDLSKPENAVKAQVVSKYALDKTSSVKTKIGNDGLLGLGFSQQFAKGVTLIFGAQIDLNALSENKHKVGSSFIFNL